MTLHHLTEDGPKKCQAKPGNCPITKNTDEPHFTTFEEAQAAYEKKMSTQLNSLTKQRSTEEDSQNSLNPRISLSPRTEANTDTKNTAPKLYAPEKPDLKPITLDEIHEIINKYKNTKGLKLPAILDAPIVGYSLVGSSLYNLHHKDSDRDVFILTDSDDKKNYHKIFEDGTDIRVFTVKNFVASILDRSPANVDILKAKMTQLDKNSPMYPYLNNVRYNKYRYIDGMEAESVTQLRAALMRDEENDKRAQKSVKTALRNYVLSDRIYEQDQNYHPEFSDTQREEFYKSLHYAIEETDNTRNIVKPFLNREIEIGKEHQGNRQTLKESTEYQETRNYTLAQIDELANKLHHMAKKINKN